jgi:hypothetical protein
MNIWHDVSFRHVLTHQRICKYKYYFSENTLKQNLFLK